MRGHHHGDAQLPVHAEQPVKERALGHRVQLGRGLVEQKHPGPQHHGSGEHGQLSLAAGKLGDRRVQPAVDAKEAARLSHAPTDGAGRHGEVLQSKGKLVSHGVAHELRRGVLRHKAEGAGRLAHRKTAHRSAQHLHGPGQPAHRGDFGLCQPQKRRLARARGARQKAEGALGHRERGFAQHRLAPGAERGHAACGVVCGIGERDVCPLHGRDARLVKLGHLPPSFLDRKTSAAAARHGHAKRSATGP